MQVISSTRKIAVPYATYNLKRGTMLIGPFYILGATFTCMYYFYALTESSGARVVPRSRKSFVEFVGCRTKTLLFIVPSHLEDPKVFEVYGVNWNGMAVVESQCKIHQGLEQNHPLY